MCDFNMQNYHFIYQFKGEKRKKVRASIIKSMENRKKQIAFFEQHLIGPQREILKRGNQVLLGEIPIEHYIKSSESVTKFIIEFLKGGKNAR